MSGSDLAFVRALLSCKVLIGRTSIFVHPTDSREDDIEGKLMLIQKESPSDLYLVWAPMTMISAQRSKSPAKDPVASSSSSEYVSAAVRPLRSIQQQAEAAEQKLRKEQGYAFSTPIAEVTYLKKSVALSAGSWSYLIIGLGQDGLAQLPLFFHNSHIDDFILEIRKYVDLFKSPDHEDMYYIKDAYNAMMERSRKILGQMGLDDTPHAAFGGKLLEFGFSVTRAARGLQRGVLDFVQQNLAANANGGSLQYPAAVGRQIASASGVPAKSPLSPQAVFSPAAVSGVASSSSPPISPPPAPAPALDISVAGVIDEWEMVGAGGISSPVNAAAGPSKPIRPSIDFTPLKKQRPRCAPVSLARFKALMDEEGRVNMDEILRKEIHEGGCEPTARAVIWKYLTGAHKFEWTDEQKQCARRDTEQEYSILKSQWMSISEKQERRHPVYRELKSRIEKDVVRTDRSESFYASSDSPHLQQLYNVLMSYAFLNMQIGYCQGMSDLLSPILYVMQDEVDAFACFSSWMDEMESNFFQDQTGMTFQLEAIKNLTKLLDPELYAHFEKNMCLEFFFSFRWMLVRFKREVAFADVQRLWEVLWAKHLTPHLHLFLAVAILHRVREHILTTDMPFDEILRFVNDLADHLDINECLSLAEAMFMYFQGLADGVRAPVQQFLDKGPEKSYH